MSMTDPIADMLTRIRNASRANHDTVDIPSSKVKLEIARVLKDQGYINGFKSKRAGGIDFIEISLRYAKNQRKAITGIKRISKPGLRVYAKKDSIPKVLGGLGVAILSTPKGILTDREATSANVGGEVICYVW
ncbi:MAG: 30S ribosomal protein S8 [Actinomycetota bacterium]|nr:30S ribosomal protein S8 [Actinomycetota bacterium]